MKQAVSAGENKMLALSFALVSILNVSCDATTSAQVGNGAPAVEVEVEQVSQEPVHVSSALEKSLGYYVENDLYVIVNADIDMDGTLDKIVSSAQNMGNELIFFKGTKNGYRRALISTNLTEDGGRILGEIKQDVTDLENDEVISIETFFPKGMDIATHYISHSNNEWRLSRTIYTVSDWKSRDGVVFRCEVVQSIPMRSLASEDGLSRVQQIPDESIRDQVCTLEKPPET